MTGKLRCTEDADGRTTWWCDSCGERPAGKGRIHCSDECEAVGLRAIGQRLADARQALGLEPGDVAGKLSMSPRAYLDWERGRRQRWTHMCLNLVYVAELPVSADYLLCGDRPMFFTEEAMSEIMAKRDPMSADPLPDEARAESA